VDEERLSCEHPTGDPSDWREHTMSEVEEMTASAAQSRGPSATQAGRMERRALLRSATSARRASSSSRR
jgi:hypothetical protein